MDKKVLILDGSARKKNTYNILKQVETILKSRGHEVEFVNLFDYEINDCVGCEQCVGADSCHVPDGMAPLIKKILDSDGLVLSSPVYLSGVTSKFKTFADRTNIWMHKPETAGMPVMFVSTTAATGMKETVHFFKAYATGLGARVGEAVTRTGPKMKNPVREKELSRFLSLLELDKSRYRPAMNEIVMFTVQKVMAGKSGGDDRKFWEEKAWLDKRYYYPCKMNPLKKLFSAFMLRVLTKAMS
jgi:multimeric flavodoxin WrbA